MCCASFDPGPPFQVILLQFNSARKRTEAAAADDDDDGNDSGDNEDDGGPSRGDNEDESDDEEPDEAREAADALLINELDNKEADNITVVLTPEQEREGKAALKKVRWLAGVTDVFTTDAP